MQLTPLYFFKGDGQTPKCRAEPWQLLFLCKALLASVSYHRPWTDKTQLPAPPLPVIQDPSTCPLRGSRKKSEKRRGGGRKGGTTLGTPFPSDPSPITVPTACPRLNNNRGSSLVASFCAFIMFTGWFITQAGQRAHAALSHSLYN